MVNYTITIASTQTINGVEYTQEQLVQGLAQIRTQYNQRTGESLTDAEFLQWAHLQNCAAWYEQNKGGEPVATSPVEPEVRGIDARRLRLALFQLGHLDDIEAAIVAFGEEAVLNWKHATIVKEDNHLVSAISTQLGLDINAVITLALSID